MKKFGINSQLQNKLLLIVIHRFSLVKVAINAPRICKMRNGVSKTPSISFFFQLPKAEQRSLRTCQLWRSGVFEAYIGAFTIVNCIMKKKHLIQVRNEYSSQLSKLLYNCKLKNKEAL